MKVISKRSGIVDEKGSAKYQIEYYLILPGRAWLLAMHVKP